VVFRLVGKMSAFRGSGRAQPKTRNHDHTRVNSVLQSRQSSQSRAILADVIVDDLRRAPLFAGLTDTQLGKLGGVARPVTLPANASVFLQGDRANAFYLLVEGTVKVAKTFRDGRGATIRYVRPGETFGESVLFNDTYPSSTETLEPSRLYRFDTGEFRRLILTEPELALLIIAAMAQLLVMLNQRIEELLLPVPARLARYLLDLCSEQATPSQCRLAVARRELAARLGTVPETLSRTLHRFIAGGLIAVRGNAIEVLNRSALERLAQQHGAATPGRQPAAAQSPPFKRTSTS
jgi:CRP/FNR family transcriptional regulator